MATKETGKKKRTKTKQPAKGVPQPTEQAVVKKSFPIVALGASAGGLEAFEVFFRSLPRTNEAAFVVISHLDPKHASMMSELISRFTRMEVSEAANDMEVGAGHVYVIPPNRNLSISQGRLQLTEQEKSLGMKMPIDAFLRTLADDQGENSVAIILSGTGTDGTLGVRALQAAGGVTFVQDPSEARYDGMPQSAIQTGLADYVLPVEEIARQLSVLFRRYPVGREELPDDAMPNVIQKVLSVVRAKTGHDFSLYKKNTMNRRIRRRMSINNIQDGSDYVRYLREHPEEVEQLFKELLITVTNFFREPEAFDNLKNTILPGIFKDKPEDYTVRVWVPGCATGEEAYSIAIVIREYAEETGRECRLQMFATDMDETSIAQARTGLFPSNIAADVTPARLAKYFVKEEAGYRVRKDIREGIVFATQDVAKDAPFTRLDLVSCRNLLIYMESELQSKIITIFHYSLKTNGILFLGSSESVGTRTDLFRVIDRKWKYYQAKPASGHEAVLHAAFASWPPEHVRVDRPSPVVVRKADLEETVRTALLASFAPPAIVVNDKGDILYIYGDTTKYLTPSPGRPSLNITHMTREGLRFPMRSALMAAATHQKEAVYRNVKVKVNGTTMTIDLAIRPLPRAEEEEALFMFTFGEVSEEQAAERTSDERDVDREHLLDLEKELIYTRESLQAAAEEAQAANEELKSANEELQSSNEELQSTNEELETSKEELQSVNEELTTVNAELRSKIEQLSQSENDMKNLLDSTDIATVFLDNNLNIKRFNSAATKVVSLIPSDAGRPVGDVTMKIEYPDLPNSARDVINRLRPFEAEVRSKEDRWFVMRIVPYRTLDNVIDGVVMTFTDITESKCAADERARFFEHIVQTVREPFLVLNEDLRVVMANRSFLDFFKVRRDETEGRVIRDLGKREWDIPVLRGFLSDVIKTDEVFEDFRVEADFPSIGHHVLVVNARKIKATVASDEPLILLAMEDFTSKDCFPGETGTGKNPEGKRKSE
ncbi:MAG TPA: chemotaxis protein CheB [Syntrophorhabdaceae bacterium]|nr:chemotaxis protein CheB [Syntrophorhabdaceae bacterium]